MSHRSHAILDKDSRYKKARKIEHIVQARKRLEGARVLDVGTGSGFIAEYLASRVGPDGGVVAVDRSHELRTALPIEYHLVEGTDLPLADSQFDLVVYNHVIEHVGARVEQVHHLREMHRVLKRDGLLYLAVPNRWAVLEPHYRLPFLSWLPRGLADRYVRSLRGADRYDCRPLSVRTIRALLLESDFDAHNVTLEALRYFLNEESSTRVVSLLQRVPTPVFASLTWAMPTFVFLARKRE